MAGFIHITHAGTELLPAEVELVRSMARRHGRATLLVPSFAEMEVCRQGLANAGAGTSVDVLTPAAWVEGLVALAGRWFPPGDLGRPPSAVLVRARIDDRRRGGAVAPSR